MEIDNVMLQNAHARVGEFFNVMKSQGLEAARFFAPLFVTPDTFLATAKFFDFDINSFRTILNFLIEQHDGSVRKSDDRNGFMGHQLPIALTLINYLHANNYDEAQLEFAALIALGHDTPEDTKLSIDETSQILAFPGNQSNFLALRRGLLIMTKEKLIEDIFTPTERIRLGSDNGKLADSVIKNRLYMEAFKIQIKLMREMSREYEDDRSKAYGTKADIIAGCKIVDTSYNLTDDLLLLHLIKQLNSSITKEQVVHIQNFSNKIKRYYLPTFENIKTLIHQPLIEVLIRIDNENKRLIRDIL